MYVHKGQGIITSVFYVQALLVELLSKYALLAPVTSTTLSACFRDLKNASQDNWELVSSLHIGVEKQQCPKECEDLGGVPAVTPKVNNVTLWLCWYK